MAKNLRSKWLTRSDHRFCDLKSNKWKKKRDDSSQQLLLFSQNYVKIPNFKKNSNYEYN